MKLGQAKVVMQAAVQETLADRFCPREHQTHICTNDVPEGIVR